jgi:hypothetical protein
LHPLLLPAHCIRPNSSRSRRSNQAGDVPAWRRTSNPAVSPNLTRDQIFAAPWHDTSLCLGESRMRCVLRFGIAAQITTCLLNHADCRLLCSGVQITSLGLNMCCATLAHRPESPYRCGAPRTLVFPPQCERLNPRRILCLLHLYLYRSVVH